MTTPTSPTTGAENVRWDLRDLYAAPDDPQLDADMAHALALAHAFATQYRGRVAALDTAELVQAMTEYEEIVRLLTKIGFYAYLAWSVDTQNPVLGKLMARKDDHATEVEQLTLFFELEWANAPQETADRADHPALQRYGHYLKQKRLLQPYTLSEAEEKVISQLSLTSSQGWSRYFDEVSSRLTYPVDGRNLTYAEVANLLFNPDRTLRQKAAESMSQVFAANRHTMAYIFNMVVLDKASKDNMRGYPSWITARNLYNQVADETVEALVTAVTSRYNIVSRYYHLLKQQLGYNELFDYDRYAPITQEEPKISWPEARAIVLQAFHQFHPHMAEIAQKFFDNQWIDAPPQPGKMGGAYCAYTTTDKHPYIFMNYTGDLGQVMTLAHELGHAIHFYLARPQGDLQASTPLTTAEMASTFCEMLVFDYLMAQQTDPALRLAMRMQKVAETFATVQRQIALNRFEHAIHTARREGGELSIEQFNQLWLQTQHEQFGNSITLRPEYQTWWMPISHFVSLPGYVYSYAFGELLVWALYARYKQQPTGFADRYLDVLRAGGSDWPHHILAPMGVDLQDPQFWQEGLDLLEDFVAEMESEVSS